MINYLTEWVGLNKILNINSTFWVHVPSFYYCIRRSDKNSSQDSVSACYHLNWKLANSELCIWSWRFSLKLYWYKLIILSLDLHIEMCSRLMGSFVFLFHVYLKQGLLWDFHMHRLEIFWLPSLYMHSGIQPSSYS